VWTPEALLRIVANRRTPVSVRVSAAAAACKFCYPTMQAISVNPRDEFKQELQSAIMTVMLEATNYQNVT
jgi:hypothetical protein